MTIADIVIKSDDYNIFDPYEASNNVYYKEKYFHDYIMSGFFKTGTDIPHGICRKVVKNREIYEGLFVNGKLNGYSRCIYNDGRVYKLGQWLERKLNGYAKLVNTQNNIIAEGIWKDDQLQKFDSKF